MTGKNLFCNHECYSKHKSKKWLNKSNPRWNNGLENFTCKKCGKSCERQKHGKVKNKYCSLKCSSKMTKNTGEKHHNWKGGTDTRYLRKIAPRPKPDRCEVCSELGSSFKKGLQYDHCHKTGKFRGWLCSNCNTALGLTKDSKNILSSLIKYLERNENHL